MIVSGANFFSQYCMDALAAYRKISPIKTFNCENVWGAQVVQSGMKPVALDRWAVTVLTHEIRDNYTKSVNNTAGRLAQYVRDRIREFYNKNGEIEFVANALTAMWNMHIEDSQKVVFTLYAVLTPKNNADTQKYLNTCIVCGSSERAHVPNSAYICAECRNAIITMKRRLNDEKVN